MTKLEKLQPEAIFIRAGRTAFTIGVHVTDNPYKEEPYRTLWTKGHAAAKFDYDRTFITSGKLGFAEGLTLEDNPYRGGPKRALWGKGWWKAKHRADDRKGQTKRPAASKPQFTNPKRSVSRSTSLRPVKASVNAR